VEVDDLVVRYGDLTAVGGISFTARAGEVLAVLGPNGAGKTSTVETLEGYRQPSSGAVRVCGLDPVADHRRLVGNIGVMLQVGGIPNQMRVGEAVRLYASYYPHPLEPAALMERVGLTGRTRATWRQLSGGEQQRLSLALALVGRPQVAFLDEPTAGIDPAGRVVVRNLVRSLADDGVCVVLTTHDLSDAQRIADRIVIMDHGRVLTAGTPDELTAGDRASFGFSAAANLDCAGISAVVDARVVEHPAGRYEVEAEPTPQRISALTSWLADRNLALDDLQVGRRTLEEVFLALTGDGDADTEPEPTTDPGTDPDTEQQS
jgi:ABC-2 type transport system ATP-binding protein